MSKLDSFLNLKIHVIRFLHQKGGHANVQTLCQSQPEICNLVKELLGRKHWVEGLIDFISSFPDNFRITDTKGGGKEVDLISVEAEYDSAFVSQIEQLLEHMKSRREQAQMK